MKPDGGPAFPQPFFTNGRGEVDWPANGWGVGGISTRDWFAGMALQGFCANPSVFAPNGTRGWGLVNCSNEDLCGFALHIADTMLAKRDEP